MTTALELSFPWGLMHATPWGRHPNEGAVEWPPSPLRLLRALYATWRARAPQLDEDIVMSLLDALAETPEYHVPPYRLAHTRHYMPDGVRAKGWEEGSDKVFDAFAAMPRGESVVVVWAGDLDPAQHDALDVLARELPYLGRAESICIAAVVDGPAGGTRTWRPVDAGTPDAVPLLAPTRPLDESTLLVKAPAMPERATTLLYAAEPASAARPPRRSTRPRPTAVRWALVAAAQPAVQATVTMAHVLREAAQSRYGKIADNAASVTLSGRYPEGGKRHDNHSHAHYLALDSDGNGLLDTLVLWAREGLGEAEVRAATAIDRLTGHGYISDFRPCRLGVEAVGSIDVVAPEIVGPARMWVSETPFAPARYRERGVTWEQHVEDSVRSELRARELPEPESVEPYRGRASWLSYRRHRPSKETIGAARNATGVRLTFRDPVEGPLALGALSHFGLGLFRPDD
jgi:CRISPR-associated protein Csb2